MRREHRAGVGSGVQLLAKLAALTPMLLIIDIAMLAVLRLLGRGPGPCGQDAEAQVVLDRVDA
jgi:hypothetical protein